MDESAIEANWLRWSHRTDVQADLPDIRQYAQARVEKRLMDQRATFEDVLDIGPDGYLHAGLIFIAELAQDDDMLQKETGLFDNAMREFAMTWSLRNTIPEPFIDQWGTA